MTAAPTANIVKPVGPVEGSLRAYLTDGNPPGGGPSWRTGMSLTDCAQRLRLIFTAEGVLGLIIRRS